MCYLVATNSGNNGCVALKTTHGKHLSEFKRSIEEKVGYEKIQLITISRPSAYSEYEPYHFVESKEEFLTAVDDLYMWGEIVSWHIFYIGRLFKFFRKVVDFRKKTT